MIFRFSNYVLDVDIERTREYYSSNDVPTMSQQCECINCQNFDNAIIKAPDSVLDFLCSLGIDPQKPIETFNVTGCLEKEGTIWYNGWYHICGTIVEGPETMKITMLSDGRKGYEYCLEKAYAPDSNFPFVILPVKSQDLLPEKFPLPVIQLVIDTHLPYVLSTPFEG